MPAIPLIGGMDDTYNFWTQVDGDGVDKKMLDDDWLRKDRAIPMLAPASAVER